jgi:hypothetical protein
MRKRCTCRICKLSRRIKSVRESGTMRQKNILIRDLSESLFNTEHDLDWHQSVLNGSWPQAEEILTRSLVSARKIREEYVGHERT